MTLRQLAEIKEKFPFLKMEKPFTRMFDNEKWAAVFSYEIIFSDQMIALCNHLQKEEIMFFFGKAGLHIQ